MDKSRVLTLIKEDYTTDALLQRVPVEKRRDVFCGVRSATQNEFFRAGEIGLRAEYVAVMFAPDYEGEKKCELDGVIYAIYRTYVARYDEIELYLGQKVGTNNA